MDLRNLINEEHSSYSAKWMPVLYEPIVGSGERFTIAIAAHSNVDADARVIQTMTHKSIKCLFGGLRLTQITDQIEWVIETLEEAAEQDELETWKSPLSGFIGGDVKQTYDIDMLGIFNQAIRRSSSLFNEINSFEELNPNTRPRWATTVKSGVIHANPELRQYINRKIKLKGRTSPLTIDFCNDQYSANIAGISKAMDTDTALAKILKLETLQRSTAHHINAELILHPFDLPENLSGKEARKLKDALSMINEEVEMRRNYLNLVTYYNPQDAIGHIITKATA